MPHSHLYGTVGIIRKVTKNIIGGAILELEFSQTMLLLLNKLKYIYAQIQKKWGGRGI